MARSSLYLPALTQECSSGTNWPARHACQHSRRNPSISRGLQDSPLQARASGGNPPLLVSLFFSSGPEAALPVACGQAPGGGWGSCCHLRPWGKAYPWVEEPGKGACSEEGRALFFPLFPSHSLALKRHISVGRNSESPVYLAGDTLSIQRVGETAEGTKGFPKSDVLKRAGCWSVVQAVEMALCKNHHCGAREAHAKHTTKALETTCMESIEVKRHLHSERNQIIGLPKQQTISPESTSSGSFKQDPKSYNVSFQVSRIQSKGT